MYSVRNYISTKDEFGNITSELDKRLERRHRVKSKGYINLVKEERKHRGDRWCPSDKQVKELNEKVHGQHVNEIFDRIKGSDKDIKLYISESELDKDTMMLLISESNKEAQRCLQRRRHVNKALLAIDPDTLTKSEHKLLRRAVAIAIMDEEEFDITMDDISASDIQPGDRCRKWIKSFGEDYENSGLTEKEQIGHSAWADCASIE